MIFYIVHTASRECPFGWKLVDGGRVILDSPNGWYRSEAAALGEASRFQHAVRNALLVGAP